METPPLDLLPKKSVTKVFCEHCQSFVGRSTYYRHRARYYDQRGKKWFSFTEEVASDSSDSDGPSSQRSISEELMEGQNVTVAGIRMSQCCCEDTLLYRQCLSLSPFFHILYFPLSLHNSVSPEWGSDGASDSNPVVKLEKCNS